MKIKVTAWKDGAGQEVRITSPIEVFFGDRKLQLAVGARKNSVTGKEDNPRIWVIYAYGTGSDDGRIYVSTQEWKTFNEAASDMQSGFEAVDPASGTEEGNLVAALIKQRVAVEA